MRYPAALSLMACAVFLAACSSVEERQQRALNLVDTASGAISGVQQDFLNYFERGQQVMNKVDTVVDEVEHRAAQVQSGVQLIQEGKEMLKEGFEL